MSHDDPAGVPAVDAAHRDPAASMLLLKNIEKFSLDPGYYDAAEIDAPKSSWARRVVALVLTAALGFGMTVSAINLRNINDDVTSPRALLAQQVRDAQVRVRTLDEENQGLQAQARASEVLEGESLELGSGLAVSAGSVRSAGPGVVVSIAEQATSLSGRASRFRDADLRAVVNILWSGGAEAMAINGHRVVASTSVRMAGSSILVNLDPVVAPYVIEAIGDPTELLTALQSGSGAERVAEIEKATSAQVTETRAESLTLGAIPLRSSQATPMESQ